MKPLVITIILFLGGIITSCSDEHNPEGSNNQTNKQTSFMHPPAQIDFVKKQLQKNNEPYQSAYQKMIKAADKALPMPHNAVADYNVPGYFQQPAEHIADSRCLQTDAFNAYSCALAYRLDAGDEYGIKACELLNAWAKINQKYSGYDGALAMCDGGSAMIIAAQLLSESDLWAKDEQVLFEEWIINIYRKACNEIRDQLKNNHADWGRFGSMLCAVYFDDKDEINENVRLIKSDMFNKIAADGSMPEETCREGKGIWYTYFSLAPMTAACWLVYNSTGENLFTWEKDGRSIKTALDYLFYYNQHPDEWKWFKNPEAGDPNWWPSNLLEAMSGIYNDQDYVQFIQPNRPLMYSNHHYAWTFPTLMPVSLKGYAE